MEPTWAIVELMGRNVIAGRISEEVIAGVAMLRVDVPACEEQPEYTKFYSGAAVYGITPTDEETATRAINRLRIAPIAPYIVAPERQLPAPTSISVAPDNPAEDEPYETVVCENCGADRSVRNGYVEICPSCDDEGFALDEPPF